MDGGPARSQAPVPKTVCSQHWFGSMMGRLQSLKKETVLVTGASWGIGRKLARSFAAQRCRLILLARKRQAIQALADEQATRHPERT
jgi:FlaA1/EpsC-like NDP-sugar epimerase